MEFAQLLNIYWGSNMSNNPSEGKVDNEEAKNSSFFETLSALLANSEGSAVGKSEMKYLIQSLLERVNLEQRTPGEVEAGMTEGMEHQVLPLMFPYFTNLQAQVEGLAQNQRENLPEGFLPGEANIEANKATIAEEWELDASLGKLVLKQGSFSNVSGEEKSNGPTKEAVSSDARQQNQENQAWLTANQENLTQKLARQNSKSEKSTVDNLLKANWLVSTEDKNIIHEKITSEVKPSGLEVQENVSLSQTSSEAQKNAGDGNNNLQPSLNNEPIISNLFTENQPIARFFNDTGQNQVVKEPEITPKELPNFILKQISNNFKFNKLTGTSELSIRLRPEELGKVTLQLLSQDGQLSVKIITENIRSMEIVEQNLAHLKQTLANQGIKCTEIEVQVNTDSTFNQFMGQQQNAFNHTRHNLRNKANYLGAYGKNEITLEGVGKEETMSFVRRNPDGLELFA